MRNKVCVLLAALSMYSCGYEEIVDAIDPPKKQVKINSALQPYVDSFMADWSKRYHGARIDNLVVEFQKQDRSENGNVVLGRCYQGGRRESPRIAIDPDYWQRISATTKKTLMYHELGHCVLNKSHVEGSNNHIMNPMIIADSAFTKNEEALLDDLFNPNEYNTWEALGLVASEITPDCEHGEGAH